MIARYKIGLVINPYAGIGGEAGFKGSDDPNIYAKGIAGELPLKANDRTHTFLQALTGVSDTIEFYTASGLMGERSLNAYGFKYHVVFHTHQNDHTSSTDTKQAVEKIHEQKVDILIFVGGDGTARDVLDIIGVNTSKTTLAMGLPSGVKMYSGVYGIHPSAVAQLVIDLIHNRIVEVEACEVRDIDEHAFRQGRVISRFYGELLVPKSSEYMQQVKQGGIQTDEAPLMDIAHEIQIRLDDIEQPDNLLIIFGPGSTTQFIQHELGLPSTLLGVDVFIGGEPIKLDAAASDLLKIVAAHKAKNTHASVKLVLTAIGGQGHLIGRGNQPLTPTLLSLIEKNNVWPVLTQQKLRNLQSRPLIIDSGDSQLNRDWSGHIRVITGYNQETLYRLEGQ